MENTNGNSMDADIDGHRGASAIVTEEQANEAQMPSEKFNLSKMPREILEHILIHLSDASLLTASHVCKRFASVAETAFARTYSKEFFYAYGSKVSPEVSFDEVMLNKYGGKLRCIEVFEGDDAILDLIERKCLSLERVRLNCIPKMIQLKNLKEAYLRDVEILNRRMFDEFITNNRQIEVFVLEDNDLNLVDLLDDRLNSLRTFKYERYSELTKDLSKIRLNSLETLKVRPCRNGTYVRLLQALECNQLKQLVLRHYEGSDDSDEVIDAICSYKTLVWLRMQQFPVTPIQLKKLAAHLPHLTKLSIRIAESESNPILKNVISVLWILPNLSKLTVHLADESFSRFLSDLKKSINDFHTCFAHTNTEIEISSNGGTVFFLKECVLMSECGPLELHWMANLNEKSVRKAIAGVRYYATDFKFINNCAEQALDVCAFLTEYDRLECLDIKSNGSIVFKENVSRHHKFFAHLKTLKLHLDKHNAIDFLEKLDNNFCERIKELWLDTNVHASLDQELKHSYDMTNILSKFKNLTSLNLAPAFAYFNAQHILFVCQSLDEIKRIRRRYDETTSSQK